VPNAPAAAQLLLQQCQPAGILLTGGGTCAAISGVQEDRDSVEDLALGWAEEHHLPVIGVCRGMQFMTARFGGTIVRVTGHVATEHCVHTGDGPVAVNSFHEFGVVAAPPGYQVDAWTADGLIEAVSHPSRRHRAMMWHPERASAPSPRDVNAFVTAMKVEA
jgi:N5-(cytidine 5'-diphosphoramidyl)-L-glutamine hydrolase